MKPDPQDRVEFSWVQGEAGAEAARPISCGGAHAGRRWLSVWYNCCGVYGRMYRNPLGTKYTGKCPRCGAEVRALIGPGGTNRRMFETT